MKSVKALNDVIKRLNSSRQVKTAAFAGEYPKDVRINMVTTVQDREKAVKQALANSALEGWEHDLEFIALLDQYIGGKISLESAIENTKMQYKQAPNPTRKISE